MVKRNTRMIAQLRKAYKPARANRFCPRCSRKTTVDGDGRARCACGWFKGMKVDLPPVKHIVNPAAEIRKP